jgi:HSP20 family protein
VDVQESEGHYLLSFDLPGVNKSDLSISLENNVLTVSGERKHEVDNKKDSYRYFERSYGNFSRSFQLPDGINTEEVNAEYKDGVLRIALTKIELVKPRKIEIQEDSKGFFSKLIKDKKEGRSLTPRWLRPAVVSRAAM